MFFSGLRSSLLFYFLENQILHPICHRFLNICIIFAVCADAASINQTLLPKSSHWKLFSHSLPVIRNLKAQVYFTFYPVSSNDPPNSLLTWGNYDIIFSFFSFRRLRKRNLKKVCLVTYWGEDVTFGFQASDGWTSLAFFLFCCFSISTF